jgi:hypothetical protein
MLDTFFEGEKRFVRPDFVLKWGEEMLSIEVLGSDAPDYLKSKKEMGEILKRHGEYFPVDAARTRGARQERDQATALLAKVNTWISHKLSTFAIR